ncbi:MAG: CbiX/SirB N-terminal domain-containing protein [Neptuniibacter sp.]
MNALLLVAHGSRRAQSNEEVTALAEKLSGRCSETYQIVYSAFLELADPLIPDGIRKCVEDGAGTVVVLPYFLNSGRHVTEDIPNIVNRTKQTYPEVDIHIASHLGASERMIDLLISASQSTAAP